MLKLLMIPVIIVIAAVSPAVAVDTLQVTSPDPILESWRWTEFDRSSGLVGKVHDVFEDRDGNIWFATTHGAQRYDGTHWMTYTTEDGLAHNQVRTIIQTRDGAMWFGTRGGGISRLDGKTWTTYTTAEGLATNSIFWRGLLQARDGTLWAGFWNPGYMHSVYSAGKQMGGISKYDGKTWTTVEIPVGPSRPNIVDMHEAFDGSLWFTTEAHGVLQFDGRSWTRYTTEDGLLSNRVVAVLQSYDGSLWFSSLGDGVSRFDGKRWSIYLDLDGLQTRDGSFFPLWQTGDGMVWTGGYGGTVNGFDGDRWKSYALEEVLPIKLAFPTGQPTRGGAVWFWGWHGTDKVFRFDPKSTKWKIFALEEELLGGFPTPDGSVWFGTQNGVVRYDGKGRQPGELAGGETWLRYAAEDGPLKAPVFSIKQTGDEALWFFAGAVGSGKFRGLSRYHNGVWQRHTSEEIGLDGIAGGSWTHILRTVDGSVWLVGNLNGGGAASRYDGQTWSVYTSEDGLVGRSLSHIYQGKNGDLWLGSTGEYGVIRFDGERWASYTEEDGLSHNRIYGFSQTSNGTIWVGTYAGLSWFDGASWRSYTFEEGLSGRRPLNFQVVDGDLWFHYGSPYDAGVTRYDGKTWRTYTNQDGLINNGVRCIYRATDGTLWFGTKEGVSWFDGTNWTNYTDDDGLPGNWIERIWQASDGTFWFLAFDGKTGTLVPDTHDPETTLEPALDAISSAGNILLRWSGRDLWNNTLPEDIRYRWRLDSGKWSPASSRTDKTFISLSTGRHTFEVQAIDQDGNNDPTSAVHAFVVESPWWRNPWFAGPMVLLFMVSGMQTVRVIRRDRRLREEAEKELQTAHDMQMSLMPTERLYMDGFDIAGRCIPASQVGGDFFQYFDHGGKLALALADVTGHAMAAAIPVVLFNGVLESQINRGEPVKVLFNELNQTLHRVLDNRTFVCFTLGELDPSSSILRLSNGGCPYPYHFRAETSTIVELQVDAYPLGVRPDTDYDVIETLLQPGDYVIFCSDGIIEAENGEGEQLGFEKTEETILQGCLEGLSAEAMIDRILEEVNTFSGDAPQGDDMTSVVLRVEKENECEAAGAEL